MSIPVKLFRSTDTNAPTLNGTAGSLIALLDACLVNGYNLKSVQGITRVGQVATVTFATAHSFAADGLTVVRHAGFDQAEYNGDFRISNVTANTYDITVTGTPATPGTGTATAKAAPVDWVKAFSGTNKGAYRSNAADGTRLLMLVLDGISADSYKSSTIYGYETMSDVDTGSGWGSSVYLVKSASADATVRNWIMAADDREMMLFVAPGTTHPTWYQALHFGDFLSELALDPFGCLLAGNTVINNANTGSNEFSSQLGYHNNLISGHYIARNSAQSPGAVQVYKTSLHCIFSSANMAYLGGGGIAYPQPNGQMYVSPIFIGETTMLFRGMMRCLYNPMHNQVLTPGQVYSDLSGLPGRNLLCVNMTRSDSTTYYSQALLDITGPWR